MPTPTRAARDDVTTIRAPIWLLTVACILTITAVVWIAWILFHVRRDAAMYTERLARIEELRGVIVHLDELLTMSARMAATTGWPRWEARYHRFEPTLDAAIKETIRAGVSASNIQAATKTDAANIRLVEMERRAFALVREGRKDDAQALLFSPEYEAQKQVYTEGLTSFVDQIRQEFENHMRRGQRIDTFSILAVIGVSVTACFVWLSVGRGLRRRRLELMESFQKRQEAENALRAAHADLEVRVADRTTDLATTNETLQAEIRERERAERQLNIQYAFSRVLTESATLAQASAEILQIACEHLKWEVGAFHTVESRTGLMRFDDLWSAPDARIDAFIAASREATFERGVGLPGRVWATGRPSWIPDVFVDDNFPRVDAAKEVGLHSAVAFPILTHNEVSGVVEFFSREIRQPDDELLRVFAGLASQLGQFLERKRLEEHLVQSQQLETVGRLAGGVAHEFNSILTAIIGQSELLLGDLPVGGPLAGNASEIRQAAGRAATLTRQLLAYGRKQLLQPEPLDLNRVIAGMEGMFHHLLNGDVKTHLVLAPGLQEVKADARQLEQVIMHIVMNARDAMPNGGTLTLDTANVFVDQDSVGRYPELKPGDYVVLAITDTGTGMSSNVKARVFEPFFSTKDVGQGVGLGMSTCYGIVKQSGGHISVYSELGRGTTFKIYLPQIEQNVRTPDTRPASSDLPRGTETILLVEDDPALREMACSLLRRLGYTVLAAANGIEALTLRQQRGVGHTDLLFTDVVMPHMSGKELAERVRALSPHTRILFTSAYTESAVVHQGVLSQGVALLQKPFTPAALAHRLREVLDQPSVSNLETGDQASSPLGVTARPAAIVGPLLAI